MHDGDYGDYGDYGGEATGDPVLDQTFYTSPQTSFRPPNWRQHDYLAPARRDREQRNVRKQARRERATAPAQSVSQPPAWQPVQSQPWPMAQPAQPVVPVQMPRPVSVVVQPGQRGAYFERRTVRRWWAPWTTRTVWQQVGPWVHGLPPSSGEVVTVASVDELPGQVRTIGSVGPTGTAIY
jgi:hypothetical protein